MSFKDSTVPVIILGKGLTPLGVLRCFGRAGVPAYCVADDLGAKVWSRWCKRIPGGRNSVSHPEQLAAFLEGLPFERSVLIPCADNWVRAVAGLSERLAQRFPTSRPSLETLELLVDKGGFADLLSRLAIPHPQTSLLESAERIGSVDVKDFAGSFLKPRDSQAFFKFYGAKAFRVKSREDAISQFERITGDGFEVLFQEYIPGPTDRHYFIDGFVDRSGEVRALFARRRLRMYPVDFGNSSYMVTVPIDVVSPAVEHLRRLFQATAYRGIFSAEFKFDDRDGEYKILEINARPWWFVEFAAVCGVDVCRLAYRDALGMRLSTVNHYKVGVTFVHPYFDLNICLQLLREGRLGPYSWARSWLKAKHPVFCVDDPLPAFAWWGKKAWYRITGQEWE